VAWRTFSHKHWGIVEIGRWPLYVAYDLVYLDKDLQYSRSLPVFTARKAAETGHLEFGVTNRTGWSGIWLLTCLSSGLFYILERLCTLLGEIKCSRN
jgi:hypothetical protein